MKFFSFLLKIFSNLIHYHPLTQSWGGGGGVGVGGKNVSYPGKGGGAKIE